jgi:threonine dehydrogenase-like Zn-dependent dehydrogenase
MQAAVYRGVNDVRIETVPVPAIGPGEVLIRVHSCGICGTDLKKIHTGSHSAPRIFGHETVGTIAAWERSSNPSPWATGSPSSTTFPAAVATTAARKLSPNVRFTSG